MHTHYDNARLSELEREAYRTQNQLALAILNTLSKDVDTRLVQERKAQDKIVYVKVAA